MNERDGAAEIVAYLQATNPPLATALTKERLAFMKMIASKGEEIAELKARIDELELETDRAELRDTLLGALAVLKRQAPVLAPRITALEERVAASEVRDFQDERDRLKAELIATDERLIATEAQRRDFEDAADTARARIAELEDEVARLRAEGTKADETDQPSGFISREKFQEAVRLVRENEGPCPKELGHILDGIARGYADVDADRALLEEALVHVDRLEQLADPRVKHSSIGWVSEAVTFMEKAKQHLEGKEGPR